METQAVTSGMPRLANVDEHVPCRASRWDAFGCEFYLVQLFLRRYHLFRQHLESMACVVRSDAWCSVLVI